MLICGSELGSSVGFLEYFLYVSRPFEIFGNQDAQVWPIVHLFKDGVHKLVVEWSVAANLQYITLTGIEVHSPVRGTGLKLMENFLQQEVVLRQHVSRVHASRYLL